MSFSRFRPTGNLDVSTDPAILPSQSDGKNQTSGAMTRCVNLRLDRDGIAETRFGSTRLANPVSGTIRKIIEQGGFRYVFAGTNIYKDESSIQSGVTDADWAVNKYKSYLDDTEALFATNGTEKYRIEGSTVRNWGITAPTVAPVGTPTGSGTTYSVYYTYVRQEAGTTLAESNASPVHTVAAGSAISVAWTDSADPQVTHVNIYVSNAGGGIGYLATTQLAGSSPHSVSVPISAGAAAPTDHDLLPDNVTALGGPVNGYMFAAVGHFVYFCKPEQPEYWPVTYYLECGVPQYPVKSIQVWGGVVYVVTTKDIWQIQGSTADTFYPVPSGAKTGTLHDDGTEAVAGYGIFHIGQDGLYLSDYSADERVSDKGFSTIFHGDTVAATVGANVSALDRAILIHYKSKLFFAYPSSTGYCDQVLVYRTSDNKVSQYDYPVEFVKAAVDYTNERVLFVDSTGYVWVVEDDTVTTDNGTEISWEIESKEFSDTLRRYFPRYAKYDVEIESGTAIGKIILDGTIVQSHTLISRHAQKRLIDSCNGRRLQMRCTGTGVIKIHAMEVE